MVTITNDMITAATLTSAGAEVISATFAGNKVLEQRNTVDTVLRLKIIGEI